MSLIQFEPGYQFLEETEFLRHLTRELGRPGQEFCAYYVPDNEAHCIGLWYNREGGWVRELISTQNGKPFTLQDMNFVRKLLSDERKNEMKLAKKMLWEKKRARERLRIAKQHERQVEAGHRARGRVMVATS